MIIDHIGIRVSDYEASKEFYLKALAPLGYGIVMEFEGVAGFGIHGKPEFWIGRGDGTVRPAHVAFKAGNREQVRKFYDAAISAGGKDNGPPGIREMYHPTYYGAFVFDPDGYNIEAVCHDPE
ncbi:MAG TPA: VOC family protein [Thermodesulfobacteriota bacterium]|nr:VOC family protein [Thermodesulfobacteriota bacterium]